MFRIVSSNIDDGYGLHFPSSGVSRSMCDFISAQTGTLLDHATTESDNHLRIRSTVGYINNDVYCMFSYIIHTCSHPNGQGRATYAAVHTLFTEDEIYEELKKPPVFFKKWIGESEQYLLQNGFVFTPPAYHITESAGQDEPLFSSHQKDVLLSTAFQLPKEERTIYFVDDPSSDALNMLIWLMYRIPPLSRSSLRYYVGAGSLIEATDLDLVFLHDFSTVRRKEAPVRGSVVLSNDRYFDSNGYPASAPGISEQVIAFRNLSVESHLLLSYLFRSSPKFRLFWDSAQRLHDGGLDALFDETLLRGLGDKCIAKAIKNNFVPETALQKYAQCDDLKVSFPLTYTLIFERFPHFFNTPEPDPVPDPKPDPIKVSEEKPIGRFRHFFESLLAKVFAKKTATVSAKPEPPIDDKPIQNDQQNQLQFDKPEGDDRQISSQTNKAENSNQQDLQTTDKPENGNQQDLQTTDKPENSNQQDLQTIDKPENSNQQDLQTTDKPENGNQQNERNGNASGRTPKNKSRKKRRSVPPLNIFLIVFCAMVSLALTAMLFVLSVIPIQGHISFFEPSVTPTALLISLIIASVVNIVIGVFITIIIDKTLHDLK